jgi:hypothetical protein
MSESTRESWQREQDAAGVTCPTCLAAIMGLALSDETEKSLMRNLVRINTGRSASKSYVASGACKAAIARLVADHVLDVAKDGSLSVLPPDEWASSRVRSESDAQLEAIRSSAPGGILCRCTPARDHLAPSEERVAPSSSTCHDADEPVILTFIRPVRPVERQPSPRAARKTR